jgi:hypothetical protein
MTVLKSQPVTEATKQKLVRYFAENPAWISAAKPLGDGVASRVRFVGDDREWNLVRRGGVSVLEPGDPVNPDFEFIFCEGSVHYLTDLEHGTIGDFATRLYECCFLLDEERRTEFRIVSSVGQIIRRGYWVIALKGGFKVLRIARAHGIGGVNDFRRLFGLLQHKGSADVREHILAARKHD